MHQSCFFSKIVISSISLILFSSPGMAKANWLVNWEVALFAEYTDNLGRSDTGEDSDVTLEPSASINATRQGAHLDAEIGARNEYRGRSNGVIGSSNNFDLDAVINWKIAPGLFEWRFEDHFNSEFPIDIRDNPNEQNTQDINSFSTGPTFTPQILNNTSLILDGRFIRTDAEESDIDNDRLQGLVGIERQLTPSSSISLNYSYEDTDFDDDEVNLNPLLQQGNIDFDRENYFLAYNLLRPSLDISAQLGYSEVNRDDGPNRNSDGANNSLTVAYTINSTSSVSLSGYDTITDTTTEAAGSGLGGIPGLAGGGFGGFGGSGVTGFEGSSIGDVDTDFTGDTVESTGFSFNYTKSFAQLGTSFSLYQNDADHDIVDRNDRETQGLNISLTMPVGSTSELGLSSAYRETDFDLDGREDEDFLLGLRGTYFARQNLRFESTAEYQDRQSNLSNADFDSIELRVGVTYTNF